jgi:hypothetical protein
MTNSAPASADPSNPQASKLTFRRVEGYKADLKYAPEIKTWPGKRVGNSISLNGEEYKIVAITKNEVVLSAPNQKKWPITATATP